MIYDEEEYYDDEDYDEEIVIEDEEVYYEEEDKLASIKAALLADHNALNTGTKKREPQQEEIVVEEEYYEEEETEAYEEEEILDEYVEDEFAFVKAKLLQEATALNSPKKKQKPNVILESTRSPQGRGNNKRSSFETMKASLVAEHQAMKSPITTTKKRSHNNNSRQQQMVEEEYEEEVIEYDNEEYDEESIHGDEVLISPFESMKAALKAEQEAINQKLQGGNMPKHSNTSSIDISDNGDASSGAFVYDYEDDTSFGSGPEIEIQKSVMKQLHSSFVSDTSSFSGLSLGDDNDDANGDNDSDYEEQVIEKWFRQEELPDNLEEACLAMIPYVYKGQDVNPETMMRRTPLPELYKYLKQHVDVINLKKEMGTAPVEDDEDYEEPQQTLEDLLIQRFAKVQAMQVDPSANQYSSNSSSNNNNKNNGDAGGYEQMQTKMVTHKPTSPLKPKETVTAAKPGRIDTRDLKLPESTFDAKKSPKRTTKPGRLDVSKFNKATNKPIAPPGGRVSPTKNKIGGTDTGTVGGKPTEEDKEEKRPEIRKENRSNFGVTQDKFLNPNAAKATQQQLDGSERIQSSHRDDSIFKARTMTNPERQEAPLSPQTPLSSSKPDAISARKVSHPSSAPPIQRKPGKLDMSKFRASKPGSAPGKKPGTQWKNPGKFQLSKFQGNPATSPSSQNTTSSSGANPVVTKSAPGRIDMATKPFKPLKNDGEGNRESPPKPKKLFSNHQAEEKSAERMSSNVGMRKHLRSTTNRNDIADSKNPIKQDVQLSPTKSNPRRLNIRKFQPTSPGKSSEKTAEPQGPRGSFKVRRKVKPPPSNESRGRQETTTPVKTFARTRSLSPGKLAAKDLENQETLSPSKVRRKLKPTTPKRSSMVDSGSPRKPHEDSPMKPKPGRLNMANFRSLSSGNMGEATIEQQQQKQSPVKVRRKLKPVNMESNITDRDKPEPETPTPAENQEANGPIRVRRKSKAAANRHENSNGSRGRQVADTSSAEKLVRTRSLSPGKLAQKDLEQQEVMGSLKVRRKSKAAASRDGNSNATRGRPVGVASRAAQFERTRSLSPGKLAAKNVEHQLEATGPVAVRRKSKAAASKDGNESQNRGRPLVVSTGATKPLVRTRSLSPGKMAQKDTENQEARGSVKLRRKLKPTNRGSGNDVSEATRNQEVTSPRPKPGRLNMEKFRSLSSGNMAENTVDEEQPKSPSKLRRKVKLASRDGQPTTKPVSPGTLAPKVYEPQDLSRMIKPAGSGKNAEIDNSTRSVPTDVDASTRSNAFLDASTRSTASVTDTCIRPDSGRWSIPKDPESTHLGSKLSSPQRKPGRIDSTKFQFTKKDTRSPVERKHPVSPKIPASPGKPPFSHFTKKDTRSPVERKHPVSPKIYASPGKPPFSPSKGKNRISKTSTPPEFLSKFKQMGIKADENDADYEPIPVSAPAPALAPASPAPSTPRKVKMGLPKRTSAPPEFLSKFKSMGIKADENDPDYEPIPASTSAPVPASPVPRSPTKRSSAPPVFLAKFTKQGGLKTGGKDILPPLSPVPTSPVKKPKESEDSEPEWKKQFKKIGMKGEEVIT